MATRTYDALVIGGGVIGLTSAYYLSEANRSVCVIDQGAIGAGASHGNCGLLVFSHLVPLCAPGTVAHELARLFSVKSPLYIAPTPDLERMRWLLAFARNCRPTRLAHAMHQREKLLSSSRRLYEQLRHNESLDCEWEERGVLSVYLSETKMAAHARTNDRLKPYGLEAKPYTGQALQTLEPALGPHVYGGWHHPTDVHLRPDRLMGALKSLLLRKGVDIIEHQAVHGLKTVHRRISRALTSGMQVAADDYVLAAGAWSADLARRIGVKLPLQAGKGYSLTLPRPTPCPRIPCILADSKVVATPWASGYRLGGTLEFSGVNQFLRPERIRRLSAAAAAYFSEPVDTSVSEHWVGMRAMTPDDLPIIGGTAYQNLVVATGHGTTGLSMATATGKLVAEMLTGKDPHIDPRPFSPVRFGAAGRFDGRRETIR